jgi:hypothetical protein
VESTFRIEETSNKGEGAEKEIEMGRMEIRAGEGGKLIYWRGNRYHGVIKIE